MNNTEYTVYWTLCDGKTPMSRVIYDLNETLRFMKNLRESPQTSKVALFSQNVDQVGSMGVDSVENGILPGGQEYVYKTGRDRGREPR